MMPSNNEIKKLARAMLIGRYRPVILFGLIAHLLTIIAGEYLIAGGSGKLAVWLTLLSSLIVTLMTLVLQAGFHYLYLQIARGYPVRLFDIFHCFAYQPDKVILMSLFLMGINLLWMLPFIVYWISFIRIPLKTLIDASVLDIPALLSGVSHFQMMQALMVIVIWLTGAFLINLRYAMAFFIYLENPSFTSADSLRESRQILAGHKQQLAFLIISFAGPALLVILSIGLAALWVGPYFSMTMALFYMSLTASSGQEMAEEAEETVQIEPEADRPDTDNF